MVTDLFYCPAVKEVITQSKEDEPEGIGTVGDQAGRKKRMSVSAGTALISLDPDFMGYGMVILHFDQIAAIMGKSRHTPLCAAMGAGSITDAETSGFFFKPLAV